VASGTTVNLSSSVRFNAVAFKSPTTVYVGDSHSELVGSPAVSISLANVYAIDLTSGQVTRVAGTAPNHTSGNIADCTPGTTATCPGDGGPATSAALHEPAGLALDSAGNLFIADDRQNVIRRVDAGTGVITTVAGVGASATGGDGGPATRAGLSLPTAIAFDSANNLYVADTLNHRIRKITASSGQITASSQINTIAGNGTASFGGDGGPGPSAELNTPHGIAVDAAGNVYIADLFNHAIREVNTSGIISTVAGQGGVAGYTGDGGVATAARLQDPYGVAVDAGGSLYITDSNNSAIRKVTGDVSHIISTIAGNGTAAYTGDGGSALNASLNVPTAITIDTQNNLYFVDNGYTVMRRILATAAPLTLPLTAVSLTNSAAFPLTVSNTSNQSVTATFTFPNNFTAGAGGTCPAGGITLAAGASCTLPVNFSPTNGGSTSGNLAITSGSGTTTNVFLSESNGLYFVPVTPCRVIDTRASDPTFGGGPFTGGTHRDYAIRNSTSLGCAAGFIPSAADVQAYSLNVTVVPRGSLSYLTVYPSGINPPTVSNLNSNDGRTKANAAIVPANTGDANRGISIYASNATDVIVDINGYYVPEANPGSLAYYPLAPCRAVDTRSGSGLLGQGAFVQGGNQRDYSLTNVCSLPSTAQAYALNYTAIPRNGKIAFLTTWPTGSSRPVASTLNAPTGAVTANAAIVPAGTNGSISAFSTDDADLIIDVAGYYAPPPLPSNPGAGGGLALYNVTPCRAFDSRASGSNPLTGGMAASQNIAGGGSCSVPATAQSYVLNTTVVPSGSLSYLTAWATGSAEPVQSVLNAYDGAITSNLAVVPTISGNVSTYASNNTGLILDLSAYFAP
jgi:sugar lactone lactonase YvrE